MLRDGRMAGLVKPQRGIGKFVRGPQWADNDEKKFSPLAREKLRKVEAIPSGSQTATQPP